MVDEKKITEFRKWYQCAPEPTQFERLTADILQTMETLNKSQKSFRKNVFKVDFLKV